MKSPKIKVCAEIDAPVPAGLSQQQKLCGGEERWVEVTLRDTGCWRHTCSVVVDSCWRSGVIVMVSDAPSSSNSVDLNSTGSLE